MVPFIKAAVRDLQSFERAGDHVFSTTKGVKPISGTTLSGWAAQVVGGAINAFSSSVRSGVETLLAANRVRREIRGHVQSHGLTGIQARHYDGHEYMLEKPEALDVLTRELTAARRGPKAESRGAGLARRASVRIDEQPQGRGRAEEQNHPDRHGQVPVERRLANALAREVA